MVTQLLSCLARFEAKLMIPETSILLPCSSYVLSLHNSRLSSQYSERNIALISQCGYFPTILLPTIKSVFLEKSGVLKMSGSQII